MFKNVLRTIETEILKMFKNIQPQPKNIRRSYKNWRVYHVPGVLSICQVRHKVSIGKYYSKLYLPWMASMRILSWVYNKIEIFTL